MRLVDMIYLSPSKSSREFMIDTSALNQHEKCLNHHNYHDVRFSSSRLAKRGWRKFRCVSDTEKRLSFDKHSLSLFSCIGRWEILAERLQSRLDFFVLLYQDKRTKNIRSDFHRTIADYFNKWGGITLENRLHSKLVCP